MTINKRSKNYKINTKNYYKKRKKGVFKDEFVYYPNGNARKNKRNTFCKLNKRDNLKVYLKVIH